MSTDGSAAWGVYVPGRRIEIEDGDFTPISMSGMGPGAHVPDERRWLVQREERSPHPMVWHSDPYPSLDAAREARYLLEDKIPYLSSMAFDEHWNKITGCDVETSLAECPTRRCWSRARSKLEAIASDGPMVARLLETQTEKV